VTGVPPRSWQERRRRPIRRGRKVAVLGVTVVCLCGIADVAYARAHRTRVGSRLTHAKKSPPKKKAIDPLTLPAVTRFVSAREGRITLAVEDLRNGDEWRLHRGARDQTASIIKVDILETLLHRHDYSARALKSVETPVAQGMIEESDNDDATTLWDEDGGPAGIAAYNKRVGMTQTTPNVAWGLTTTSAADQITLLRQLVGKSKLLTPAAQRYQLYLMRHIAAGENWGVTGGVPRGVSVALKNGWLPLDGDDDWEINSIGWVRGSGRDYLIAALTTDDPSEAYGIDTIEQLSADVFKALKLKPSHKPKPKT
jgi:beta-lactamase class A